MQKQPGVQIELPDLMQAHLKAHLARREGEVAAALEGLLQAGPDATAQGFGRVGAARGNACLRGFACCCCCRCCCCCCCCCFCFFAPAAAVAAAAAAAAAAFAVG
jgi:hypothetical protein